MFCWKQPIWVYRHRLYWKHFLPQSDVETTLSLRSLRTVRMWENIYETFKHTKMAVIVQCLVWNQVMLQNICTDILSVLMFSFLFFSLTLRHMIRWWKLLFKKCDYFFFNVSTIVTTELSTGPSLAPPNVSEFNIPLYHSCKSSLLAPSLTWFVRSLPAPHLCGELVNFNIACTACSKPGASVVVDGAAVTCCVCWLSMLRTEQGVCLLMWCVLRARMFFWFCIVDLRQTHVQVVCTVHDDDEMSWET